MAVFRVNKTADYTVMSNFHLRDRRMSLKAKGLLSLILSLPDDWNYTIGGLVSICTEKEVAVKTALTELKKNGYLRVDKIRPTKENGGKYEYVYNIFEQPHQAVENQGIENLPLENQPLENLAVENIPLYKNTKSSNTDLQITNTSSIDVLSDKPTRKRFIPPTLEEVQAYCLERNNNVDAERFINHYTSNGWMVGKNKMQDWKAAVRTWEKNGYNAKTPKRSNTDEALDFYELGKQREGGLPI